MKIEQRTSPFGRSVDPMQIVLQQLRAKGIEPKQSSNGFESCCPAHDDRKPSLSIGRGEAGRVLLHCQAGCTFKQVVLALGLQERDLGPPNRPTSQWTAPARSTGPRKPAFDASDQAIAAAGSSFGGKPTSYEYTDASGEIVGVICRWDIDGGKEIRPVAKTARGWVIGGMETPRPLYRILAVMNAEPDQPVIVCEGEKAAEAAVSCGLLATTSAHGASSAAQTDWGPLRGRRVVIAPDLDAGGEKYARAVAGLVHAADASSVRIIDLRDAWPELAEGDDLADVVEQKLNEPEDIAAEVLRLGEEAGEVEVDLLHPIEPPRTESNQIGSGPTVLVRPLEDFGPPEPVEWIWPGYLAVGHTTLLSAAPKVGKTTLVSNLVRDAATGSGLCEQPLGSPVLIWSEENPRLWQQRAEEIGCPEGSLHLVERQSFAAPLLPEWEENCRYIAEVAEQASIKLVVIDTLPAICGFPNENDSADVLARLAPLQAITDSGAGVLLVHHARKSGGSHGQDARGSSAITGFPDMIVSLNRLSEDNSNSRRRVIEVLGRLEGPPEPQVIELTDNGYQLVGDRRQADNEDLMDLIGSVLPSSRSEAIDAENMKEVLDAELDRKTGLRRVRGLLNDGVDQSRWQRSGTGNRGDAWQYWKPPAEEM